MLVTKIMINTINITINYAVWLQEFYEGGTRSICQNCSINIFAPDKVAHIFVNCTAISLSNS